MKTICLVVQDWGGLLGLTLPLEAPDRYTRLLVMNTGLPAGENAGEGFAMWRAYAKANPDLDVAALMKRATPVLTDAEAASRPRLPRRLPQRQDKFYRYLRGRSKRLDHDAKSHLNNLFALVFWGQWIGLVGRPPCW